jgi:hypothetical protein
MYVIRVTDFSRGDSWVQRFGKPSKRARAMRLATVREKHFAKTFETREEAAAYASRIEMAYLVVDGEDFDLEVVGA